MNTNTTVRPANYPDLDWITQLRERLLANAFLFDDPHVYQAGVEDTLDQIGAYLHER